jgi:hypothetical protein
MKRILKLVAELAELVGGIVGGALLGFIGFLGAFIIGGTVLWPPPPGPPYPDPPFGWYAGATILGFLVGSLGVVIGIAVGVYLVGRLLGQKGSFWFAILGSILGSILACGGDVFLPRILRGYAPLTIPILIVPSILAILGFNLGLESTQPQLQE